MLRELETALGRGVAGDVVEFGCYVGTTSLYIRRVLDHYDQSGRRQFRAYDSFAGLPPKSAADQSPAGSAFQAGALETSKRELLQQFQKAGLRPPIVRKAWFEQLTSVDLPKNIAFAFLDGDFYTSIHASLRLVWPDLSSGGSVVIDDYGREALPGVERAAGDFFQHRTVSIRQVHDMAVILKP